MSVLCAQSPLLKSSGYVNDFAELLDPPARVALSERLKEVETRTSSEIAVATVKSLDGMSVEEFANRLFKAWGVGQEKTDNGVLPDGLAGEIRDEQFLPKFRNDDYAGGIVDGVNRIAEIVEKN